MRARGELLLSLYRGREAAADLEKAMQEAAAAGATAEEMEALLRLGRAWYVVGLDHRPAIAQSLQALERARDLAVKLGDRHAEARALIPTHRHTDFDPTYAPQAAANAKRALALARELGDEDLEIDALRAAHRTEIVQDRLVHIERIAANLERRGDLIALNEHLFDAMWAYWRGARFAEAVACADRATALAARLGIPPVQYGTIKSFSLLELGHFDEAWQALEQEVADEAHPFGRAFQHLGRTWWHAAAGDFDRVLADLPRLFSEARALQRTWMLPWAEGMLANAIIARSPPGTSERQLGAEIEKAGGRLADEARIAAHLHAGNAAAAIAASEACMPQFERVLRLRNRWLVEEMRLRALLTQERFEEVRVGTEAALAVVTPLGWRALEWRLRAVRAQALAALGDRGDAAVENRAATGILRAMAQTLDPPRRAGFLAQPQAAALLAARELS